MGYIYMYNHMGLLDIINGILMGYIVNGIILWDLYIYTYNIPSGNLLHSYRKLSFIVDLPMKQM